MDKVCIYHGSCADGFTSARVINKKFQDVSFHAGYYGETPPDVVGKIVYIVDFSYPRDVMEKIVQDAHYVVHIDHHETAIAAMLGFEAVNFESSYSVHNTASGAMLCWQYFFPDIEVPDIIKHVDDRDRWKFLLDGTKEISANMFSYEYTFENWDKLMSQELAEQIRDGAAIERRMTKDAKELAGVVVRRMSIAGYDVPCANVPYQYGSDLCSMLAIGEPFAAYYYDKPTHREFGLRSAPGAVNVADVAKIYGGGGHANASGFRRSFDQARDFEL